MLIPYLFFTNMVQFSSFLFAAFLLLFLLLRVKKYPATLVAILSIESGLTVFRSILYFIDGNYGQHFSDVNSNNYAIAQLIETCFMFALLHMFKKFPDPIETYLNTLAVYDRTPFYPYIIVQCLLILLCFLLSGTTWVHGNRETTISISSPVLRYIFPALLFIATILGISALKYCVLNVGIKKIGPISLLISTIVTFMMIGQRGLFIIIAAASFLGFYKSGRIELKKIIFIFSILFFYGIFSRSVADGSFNISSLTNVLNVFVNGGDGTKLDSIAFAIFNMSKDAVESLSVTYELLTIIPHQVRIDYGIPTVSDYLNTVAVGDYYYNFGNGYNFGNMSIFIVLYGYAGPVVCLLFAYIYKRNFRAIVSSNSAADTTFLFILCMMLFIESIGSIHWVVYTFVMISSVRACSGFFSKIK